jgi:hypothetical protein
MAHVFDGDPDGRQSPEPIPVSRFRPTYRALTDQEKALHDAIKGKAVELEALFNEVRDLRFPVVLAPMTCDEAAELQLAEPDPAGEYLYEGMKALELAVMWTVKALTSGTPAAAEPPKPALKAVLVHKPLSGPALFDVLDADGKAVNAKPLLEDEAQAIIDAA